MFCQKTIFTKEVTKAGKDTKNYKYYLCDLLEQTSNKSIKTSSP